jgi:hypothetical protein
LNIPPKADITEVVRAAHFSSAGTGEVLQQDDNVVAVKGDYGTVTYQKSSVKDVRLTSSDGAGNTLEFTETNRIPSWGKIVSDLTKPAWADKVRQIPATVIDEGVLKNVPYVSFHCSGDCYELNIYGDLDNPAGVEIGVLKNLANNERARSNCVNFIASVLTQFDDQRIARSLKHSKQVVTNEDLTFEITLPDEPDAYGGWWISVYSESELESARASGKDMLSITEPMVRPQAQISQPIAAAPPPTSDSWSSADMSYSRKPSRSSGSGGSVYVHSYFRKDGTYVGSYTRSAPHRH